MATIQEVLDDTIVQFHADSGTVHLLGEDGLLHLRAASKSIPEPVLKIVERIPVGKGMAGLAVERAEPVSACNIQTTSGGDVRPGAKATGMEGAIVVPVMKGERAVGAFGIANRTERTFTADEIAKLKEIADTLAGEASC